MLVKQTFLLMPTLFETLEVSVDLIFRKQIAGIRRILVGGAPLNASPASPRVVLSAFNGTVQTFFAKYATEPCRLSTRVWKIKTKRLRTTTMEKGYREPRFHTKGCEEFGINYDRLRRRDRNSLDWAGVPQTADAKGTQPKQYFNAANLILIFHNQSSRTCGLIASSNRIKDSLGSRSNEKYWNSGNWAEIRQAQQILKQPRLPEHIPSPDSLRAIAPAE
ncbi:hypothetical protein An02g03610 [Aspergillus niger]|uniref:Uncharacterized protein n=2 Tax=Aspergillus niger TaxID=5061 RepID=A2QCH7_ASPNC|nr:hypothetical protein An02g03610 [Aspergillus niger]CAK47641.1 hypothetical protein An02g03610 [Aspergillus niger]